MSVTVVVPTAKVWLAEPEESVTRGLACVPAGVVVPNRTYRLPLAKPPICVKVTLGAHVLPSEDNSRPVGAVAMMLAAKLPPETSTGPLLLEASPYVVLSEPNVPLGVMAGVPSPKANN